MNNLVKHTKLDLIHYGNNELDLSRIKPIENDWIKPKGGLWASPASTNFGWKEWNAINDFSDTSIYFEFTYIGDILIIDSLKDLQNIKEYIFYSEYWIKLDFEKMVNDKIDAMLLTENGEHETRYNPPECLNGWDCESICIFNPNGINV